jgi:hypothetical protein
VAVAVDKVSEPNHSKAPQSDFIFDMDRQFLVSPIATIPIETKKQHQDQDHENEHVDAALAPSSGLVMEDARISDSSVAKVQNSSRKAKPAAKKRGRKVEIRGEDHEVEIEVKESSTLPSDEGIPSELMEEDEPMIKRGRVQEDGPQPLPQSNTNADINIINSSEEALQKAIMWSTSALRHTAESNESDSRDGWFCSLSGIDKMTLYRRVSCPHLRRWWC